MRTTKKLLLISLCAAAVFVMHTAAVSAAVVADQNTSDADILFTENAGPTKPVDPEDPKTPDPDPEKPARPGSLAIVWVSDFSFGSIPVSQYSQNYYTTTFQPNLQVVDLRGNLSGWSVSASLSRFEEVDEQGNPIKQLPEDDPGTLRGAILHITDGDLNSVTEEQYAPEVRKDVQLLPGQSTKTILSADTGRGAGLWVDRWYPANTSENNYVYLEVPAGVAEVGSHVATITWQLVVAP